MTRFGETDSGERVHLFRLTGGDRVDVSVMTYGATLQSVIAPGRDGTLADIALGFATLGDYVENRPYFGATVGRYANRIADARFVLDGIVHELSRNDGGNCLHGGARGFDTKVWEVLDDSEGVLVLGRTSPDGEMGFPGEVAVQVAFRLDGPDLRIDYRATTSAPTVLNLTNHTCWNLAGEGSGSVDDHVLRVDASAFTPVDAQLIPTGEIAAVDGTPFDFRDPVAIGARGRGYDENFVLDGWDGSLIPAAFVTDPASGRTLEVLTTEPGVQLYTGTVLDGTARGPSGRPYRRGDCVALETQHFPDSPNQPAFPPTTLRPDEVFESTTVYRFGVAG